jgi:hypothetical protein
MQLVWVQLLELCNVFSKGRYMEMETKVKEHL